LIRRTFCCGPASISAGAKSTSAGACFVGSGSGGSGEGNRAGGAGFEVASSDARIREIGGRTVRFVLVSPSCVFFVGRFRSINETVSGCGVACPETSGFSDWLLSCFAEALGSAEAAVPFPGSLVFAATSAGF
jgi:hypothetical protein